ncbi:MFS transporter [Tichowtungia aerotolerans]|uniref:MFS transporter n=1 Tax=Tichowtungia aerotolerans TaxID=2697043 RepID=A0A6P1M5Q8_9BACT|nr:MFS transporter [Tichowtungia aerotolerans]QHI69171.1 MFS transporter [Tichowtungia aerotolerans]
MSMPEKAEKKGTLSKVEKTAWGVSGSSENILHNTTNIMANPILNIGLGVSPVLVSAALTIPRIWDAFTDPLMGKISDNFKSKMGRRRPFVLFGGILTGLAFAMIWMLPRGWSQMATFSLFLFYMLIFYTCFTVFIVPYLALGFEMSPDYNERTTLMSYRSFFSLLGGIIMQWIYWGCTRPCFDDTVQGMKVVGSVIGGLVILTSVITALFCKERAPQGKKDEPKKKISFYESVSVAWKVDPFIRVISVCVLIIVGQLSIMQLGMYLNIYYVCKGSQEFAGRLQGVIGTGYTLSSLVIIPAVAWCSNRFGKQITLRGLMLMGTAGSLLSWVLINPDYPYLQMVGLFLGGPAVTGLWIVAPSMIADVCDWDEWKNGLRREGAFGAVYGWFTKIGSSLSVLVSGFVLVLTGFSADLGVDQPEGTIIGMRVLVALVPAATFIIAFLILRRYDLSADLINRIKQEKAEA